MGREKNKAMTDGDKQLHKMMLHTQAQSEEDGNYDV